VPARNAIGTEAVTARSVALVLAAAAAVRGAYAF
jgi:hypothetical protein